MIVVFAILLALQCASSTIILDCTYSMRTWAIVGSVYQCSPRIIQLDQTRNVVGVSQNHLTGKRNQDVEAIFIDRQPIDLIPKDIELFFGNIETLIIWWSPIKSVTKDDLKPFPKLKVIEIQMCQIGVISGDIFKYSPELQFVNFQKNEITNVGPGVLEPCPKLIIAHFNSNLCIDNGARNSTAVATIARELAFKCPPTVDMIEEIILEGEIFRKAVNTQIQPDITTLNNNQAAVTERMLQLEKENKKDKERIENLEKVIFNLCAVHAICN